MKGSNGSVGEDYLLNIALAYGRGPELVTKGNTPGSVFQRCLQTALVQGLGRAAVQMVIPESRPLKMWAL